MILAQLEISKIRLDGGTQTRARTDQCVVDDYCEKLKAGCRFPVVTVFKDSSGNYWLGDGFHRLLAHKQAKRKCVDVDLRSGELRDAILFAVGANREHGLQRKPEDKRCAVGKLLRDPEWTRWSNVQIADQCWVSEKLVRTMRRELRHELSSSKTRIARRGNSVYPMKTNAAETPEEEAAAINEANLAEQFLGDVDEASDLLTEAAGLVERHEQLEPVGRDIGAARRKLAAYAEE